MLAEPIAQRFIRKIEATRDNKVRTADDVLGERLMRIAAFLIIEHEQPGQILLNNGDMPRAEYLLGIARLALLATPYFWTEETRRAVTLDLPRHVISPRALPTPKAWHTFHTGLQLGGKLVRDGRTLKGNIADAMLVVDAGEGIMTLVFGEMSDEDGQQIPTVTGGPIRYGLTYPDAFEGAAIRPHAESVLAMCAFLNSPYIPKRTEQASRAARRESARLGHPLDDEVTFVVLRRPHGEHKGGEGEPVAWAHRWIVSGHMRAQWYPSEEAHRLIWIAPYLKGPEDKPLLEHVYKVAR